MQRKLLVIDDQPGITKAIGLVAKQLGLAFRAVNSSLDAIEEYIEYRPDIVILDMIMPEKDGLEVLGEILLTGIPSKIVLTSGYGGAFLHLAQGVADFHGSGNISILQKPYRRDELVNLLNELSRGADPPAASGNGKLPPAVDAARIITNRKG